MSTFAAPDALIPRAYADALPSRRAGVPWYIYAGAAAITSSAIGGAWDVSWHRSIGRDTFWTPAHMMIYLCGVLAGVIGLALVARATLDRTSDVSRDSVSLLGLRAPLGVFLAGWGGVAMLTSAPFDNWWHAAYGLDVKIVSPPHTLLILGIRAVAFGMMLLTVAAMNRARLAGAASYVPLRRVFLYIGGLSVIGTMFFLQESTWDILQHTTGCYVGLAIGVPFALCMFAVPARSRWPATAMCTMYMLWTIAEILILPLFPATPKLGPVYVPVTHMVPTNFPVLLVVPAVALDLLWQHTGLQQRENARWRPWHMALATGVVFVAAIAIVQWPFADFLLSKWSNNRFFGSMYEQYNARPNSYTRLRLFAYPAHGVGLAWGLLRASVFGTISAWLGLRFGGWLKEVQR